MNCCCWIQPKDTTEALLVIGGRDNLIQVLSLQKCKVIKLMTGHTAEILALERIARKEEELLSISLDNTIRQWNVESGHCLAVYHLNETPNCIALDLPNNKFICSVGAELRQWDLVENNNKSTTLTISTSQNSLLANNPHKSPIDCIKLIDDCIVSKSIDGKMYAWKIDQQKIEREFKLKKTKWGRFDVSCDQSLLAVGNEKGSIVIFDYQNAKMVNRLKFKRSKKPINDVAFDPHLNNLIAVSEPFIWRWEYKPDLENFIKKDK